MCTNSRDCLEFLDDGVLSACLVDLSLNKSFCGCNNFYVRTGANCENVTTSLLIFQFQALLNLSIALKNIITGITYNLKNKSSSFSSNLLRKQRLIIICQIFGNSFFFASYVLLLPTLFSSKKLELSEIFCLNETVEKVLSLNSIFILPMSFLGLSFITIGSFILVFSWFGILKDMSRYFPKLWGKRERTIETTLQLTFPVCLILTLVFILIDQLNLTMISGGFGFTVFFGCFSFLMNGFTKNMFLLCKDSKNRNKVIHTTLRIRKEFFKLAFCLVASSVFFALAAVNNVKCSNYPGNPNINKEAFYLELAFSCYLVQSIVCFKEVKQNTKTLKHAENQSQQSKFSKYKSQA